VQKIKSEQILRSRAIGLQAEIQIAKNEATQAAIAITLEQQMMHESHGSG
jgi:hypothetical protein